MDSGEDFEDEILSHLSDAANKEGIWEGESSRPNEDGQTAAGELIAGTGETEHQTTHDEARPSIISGEATTQLKEINDEVPQKSTTSCVGKRGREPPLDDEEKKERKKIADVKYRMKIKKAAEDTKNELQETKKEVESLKKEGTSLNEEKNRMFKKLQDSDTENGRLQQKISDLKEKISVQEQKLDTILLDQNNVMKMEEDLRVLKTKCNQLESMNAFLMVERKTMENNLHITASNIGELELKIYSLNETNTKQQQLLNMLWNELNQELPMDQGKVGQEENGRLSFEGGGGSIIGTPVSEIQFMHWEMSQQIENCKRETEKARIVCAEGEKQMLEVAKMVEFWKSIIN